MYGEKKNLRIICEVENFISPTHGKGVCTETEGGEWCEILASV
jgi:hypothetical protein